MNFKEFLQLEIINGQVSTEQVYEILRSLRRKLGNLYCKRGGTCKIAAVEVHRVMQSLGCEVRIVNGTVSPRPSAEIIDPTQIKPWSFPSRNRYVGKNAHWWVEWDNNGEIYILDITADQFSIMSGEDHWNLRKGLQEPVIVKKKSELPEYEVAIQLHPKNLRWSNAIAKHIYRTRT